MEMHDSCYSEVCWKSTRKMHRGRHCNLQIFRGLTMVVQLFLLAYFMNQRGRANAAVTRHNLQQPPPVVLSLKNQQVVMSNGILSVTLSAPAGMVTKISYNGDNNLLEAKNKDDDKGYWNIIWNMAEYDGDDVGNNRKSSGIMDRLTGTRYEVILQNENQTEISFTRTWNRSSGGKEAPLNVDKRFIMLRGSSGFYTYTVLERLKGWPQFDIEEARVVFKLQSNKFHYMAISDQRQRIMPTPVDRKKGKVLDYPEAVLLTHPTNPRLKGEVDDKYFYSCDNIDNRVYGWVGRNNRLGFWMITPSDEFRTGGPFKQDLTTHVGPIVLNMFVSNHYAGKDLVVKFRDREPWKKVLGPVFVYLNSHATAKKNPSILWQDAKQNMLEEVAKWPYTFPVSKDFVKSNGRGGVRGQLLVIDRYINKNPVPAASAYVGLAPPGAAGSWQRETMGYQFWTRADSNGNFVIKNVIAGTYSLHAWVPGTIGDFLYNSLVHINSGSDVNLGSLVYKPPRNGPTLWEIGVADRTAAEFYIPEPKEMYKVHQYKTGSERFRQYGLWRRYTDLYPRKDLVYTVGVSDYKKDWFFAQVTRYKGKNTYRATTWEIRFNLKNLKGSANYTLQLALASASRAELQVRINNRNATVPHFTTGLIGHDNAVARHGIHGLYWFYSIGVAGNLLVNGRNTIFLTQTRDTDAFKEIMYDYIRLEEPPYCGRF